MVKAITSFACGLPQVGLFVLAMALGMMLEMAWEKQMHLASPREATATEAVDG